MATRPGVYIYLFINSTVKPWVSTAPYILPGSYDAANYAKARMLLTKRAEVAGTDAAAAAAAAEAAAAAGASAGATPGGPGRWKLPGDDEGGSCCGHL
jgi:hypothetical protein